MMDFGEAAMSRDELQGFLMDEPRYASVASLRRDGAPFVTPLGFVYDGTNFYFSIPPSRGYKADASGPASRRYRLQRLLPDPLFHRHRPGHRDFGSERRNQPRDPQPLPASWRRHGTVPTVMVIDGEACLSVLVRRLRVLGSHKGRPKRS